MADKNSNVINLSVLDDFGAFIKKVKKEQNVTGRALDMLVTEVAAKGRRAESEYEANAVHLGFTTKKGASKKTGFAKHVGGSVWDATLGGYRPASATSDMSRLIHYSFETKASKRRRTTGNKSEVKMTSQVFNLFAQNTKPYSADSPYWWNSGYGSSHWWRVKKGDTRKRKFTVGDFKRNVESTLPKALAIAERKFQGFINEEERGN